MDLWRKISGTCRVRLTGADPVRTLRILSSRMRLEEIVWEDALTVRMEISRKDRRRLLRTAQPLGDRVEVLEESGLPQLGRSWKRKPILAGWLAALTVLSLWLPGRILFFRVEGNELVPAAQILEAAADCGLTFGTARRALRSEQIKNALLSRLPQLSWAGVNTDGCVATVTVRERDRQERPPAGIRGDIVAGRSGIVTDLTAAAGTPLCRPGQAVQKGDLLISGVQDLGICTRITPARGTVFARTGTRVEAVLPRETVQSAENGKTIRRVRVIFGKKHINLYSDSGILSPGCGKMREVIPLCLPGGWRLPVTLVVDTCELRRWNRCSRPAEAAEALLREQARREVLRRSVAGTILQEHLTFFREADRFRLAGTVSCREMIGRGTDGVYWEDDAKHE